MKRYTNYIAYALAVLLFAGICFGVKWALVVEKAKQEAPVQVVPEPIDPTAVTRDFATKVIERCQAKLSSTKLAILLEQLVRVTHRRFDSEEHRQAYLALLCIESGYNQGAKSPVGATGLAQIMPQYAEYFAKLCGYSDIDPADITDSEVNLHLGSCLFSHLIEETGNVYIAMAAYNSGLNGSTTKNLKALRGGGAPETVNYVNRITVLKEDVRQGLVKK